MTCERTSDRVTALSWRDGGVDGKDRGEAGFVGVGWVTSQVGLLPPPCPPPPPPFECGGGGVWEFGSRGAGGLSLLTT